MALLEATSTSGRKEFSKRENSGSSAREILKILYSYAAFGHAFLKSLHSCLALIERAISHNHLKKPTVKTLRAGCSGYLVNTTSPN
jgi:hypothetical protein